MNAAEVFTPINKIPPCPPLAKGGESNPALCQRRIEADFHDNTHDRRGHNEG